MRHLFGHFGIGAAFACQIARERLQAIVIGPANHAAPLFLLSDQPGLCQKPDVMGQGRRREAGCLLETTDGQPVRTRAHQMAQYVKSLFRPQGREAGGGLFRVERKGVEGDVVMRIVHISI